MYVSASSPAGATTFSVPLFLARYTASSVRNRWTSCPSALATFNNCKQRVARVGSSVPLVSTNKKFFTNMPPAHWAQPENLYIVRMKCFGIESESQSTDEPD